MRRAVLRGVLWVALFWSLWDASPGRADTIKSPTVFNNYKTTTVTFEDQAAHIDQQFGFQAGQPYVNLGLKMGYQIVAKVNIGSTSDGISVRSAVIYDFGDVNWQNFTFSTGQSVVGFFYQDILATSITVKAFGVTGQLLESVTLSPGSGYTGFLRNAADIFQIEITAPHATVADASASRTYIDDISFANQRKASLNICENAPNLCYSTIYDPWWWLKCPRCGIDIYINLGDEFRQVTVFDSLGEKVGMFERLQEPLVEKGVRYNYRVRLQLKEGVGYVLRADLATGRKLKGKFKPAYIVKIVEAPGAVR